MSNTIDQMTPTERLIAAHACAWANGWLTTRAAIVAANESDPDPALRLALSVGPDSQAWLAASVIVATRETGRKLELETGTINTMPAHHWRSSVVTWARVTDADARRLAGNEISAWFADGEAVASAAPMLADLVRARLAAERSDRDRTGMKAILRAARRADR